MPGSLPVKHVSSVETDLLASTYGSSDLDFAPEAGDADLYLFFFLNCMISEMLSFMTAKSTTYCQ